VIVDSKQVKQNTEDARGSPRSTFDSPPSVVILTGTKPAGARRTIEQPAAADGAAHTIHNLLAAPVELPSDSHTAANRFTVYNEPATGVATDPSELYGTPDMELANRTKKRGFRKVFGIFRGSRS
jgi:hypothetical protein